MTSKLEEDLNFGLSALQLSDFPSAKIKVEQFMSDWLVSEGAEILECLRNRGVSSTSLEEKFSMQHNSSRHQVNSPNDLHGGPPRSPNKKSPKKRTQSEMQNNGNPAINVVGSPSASSSNTASVRTSSGSVYSFEDATNENIAMDVQISGRRRSSVDSIPRFFVRGKHDRAFSRRIEEDQLVNRLPEIEAFFQAFPTGAPVEKFVHITKKLVGIPSFFNFPLCKRIVELYGNGEGTPIAKPVFKSTGKRQTQGVIVTLKAFLQFWQNEVEPYNRIERFFRVIKQPNADFIVKDDFAPFIQELLHFHPGLDFLDSHEEFQRKYALTVVTRIFYKVNTSRTGKISLRELKHSNLFAEFMHVDEETDINLIREYFSYEHFYVLYCRFFELDADKDAKITKDDLLKYNDRTLSVDIIDRIFKVGCRAFSDGLEGGFEASGMSYPDFVIFMLAEEDRSSVAALKYWFSCCDLDGDGKLTPEEMWHFYRTQLQRVTSMGQEAILFQDVLCQMVDFICPADPHAITIEDLIKPDKRHISGVLFDVLFNLQKFLRFETRDPFQEKQKREDMFANDWDRFAYIEYHRLAAEEEGNDGGGYDQQDYGMNNMEVDYDSAGGNKGWSDGNDFDDDYGDYDDDDYSLGAQNGANRSKGGNGNYSRNMRR